MDQPAQTTDDQRRAQADQPCEAELHVRLCARRLTTGHLQFRWRVEHVDNVDQTGDSLDGTFGPFQLPHECGQELAAVARSWIKNVSRRAYEREEWSTEPDEGEQLTLRDFVADW
jgi:hypothetical protein